MSTNWHINAFAQAAHGNLPGGLNEKAQGGLAFFDQDFAGGELDVFGAIADPLQSLRWQHLKRFYV